MGDGQRRVARGGRREREGERGKPAIIFAVVIKRIIL